jgi:predicted nucleic acid-binding Zn ribbon protein
MNPLPQQTCSGCGSPLDACSNFCQQCGASVSEAHAVNSFPVTNNCPNCGESIKPGVRFCSNCGQPIAVAAGERGRRRSLVIVVAVCFGIGLLFLFLFYRSSGRVGVNAPATSSERNSGSLVSSMAQSTNQLTTAKVERAVGQLTSNLRVGGAITVDGIQEIPRENSARADLRFSDFKYKSDMAGTPLPSDRRAPEKPQIDDPDFYDKMYKYGTQQVQTKTYSGPGFALLKHYNDGRWVLKEVRWQFSGWSGNVDIK